MEGKALIIIILGQMMSDYTRVIALLVDIEKPSRVKQASQQVQAFSEQPYFINLLQHALKDPTLTHNMKLSAAVMMNRVIKTQLQQLQGMKVLEVLMDIAFNFQIDIKLKTALSSSLTVVFEETEPDIIGTIMEKAQRLLKQAKMTIQSYHLDQPQINVCGQETTIHILKLIIFLARCLSEDQYHRTSLVQSLQQFLQPSIRVINLTTNPISVSMIGELCAFWQEMLGKLLTCRLSQSSAFADKMCLSAPLNEWILQLYELGSLPAQKCFINPALEQAQSLNRMKKNAASLHKLVMIYFSKTKVKQMVNLWQTILQKGYSLISTLSVYAAHPTYFTAYQQFITELLGVLIVMLKENREHFSHHYANLMHMIIFPLLAVTEEETELFENDPEEFNFLAEDCCDKQNYGTIKTETSRLLEAACDQNQQATAYAMQHAIISLKVRLSLDQNLLNSATHFLSLETAFLVMSILSYCLGKHPNELEQLRRILVPKNLEGRLSHIQLARLFSFLAYNYTEIYPNPIQGEGWVKWALISDSHRTVTLCALDFISNIANEYFSQAFLIEFAELVFTPHGESSLRLATLLKIMGQHLHKISEDCLVVIVEQLFKTIKQQIDLYKKRERPHTLGVVSILQMIRKIVDCRLMNDSPRLRQAVLHYLELLPETVAIYIDDQVVKIVTSLIKQEKALLKPIAPMLEVFSQLFRDGRQSQLAFLLLFNSFLIFGSAPIRNQVIELLSQGLMALHLHSQDNPTSARDKIAIAAIYLLLQNTLATYGHELTNEQLNAMRDLALYLIPASDDPEDRIQPMIIARALNLLYLVHMHRRDETALRKLLVFQDSYIFRGYDLQVLSACLSKDIFRDGDVVAVTEMINILTKAIARTRDETVVIRSKKNPNSIKSDTKIRIKRIEDYEQILKFIETPFSKEIVPQAELKKVIDQMRNNNPFIYQAIVKSLTSSVYSNLKRVISEVTINGTKRNIMHAGQIKDRGAPLTKIEVKKRSLTEEEEEVGSEEDQQISKPQVKKKKKQEIVEEIG